MNEGYRMLAAAVILQAIKDWSEFPGMRGGISRFLASEWGETLCGYVKLDSKVILNKLKSGKIMYKKIKRQI